MVRVQHRLADELWRMTGTVVLTVPLLLLAQFVVVASTDTAIGPVSSVLLGWTLTSAIYAGLTVQVFAGADAGRLRVLLASSRGTRGAWWRRGGDDGPGLAVQFAVAALVIAAVLPRLDQLAPEGEQQQLLTVLSVLTVVLGWVVVGLSYTVHYARQQLVSPGLRFPGNEDPGFSDYLYFAVSVLTTLGTTDVTVTTPRMRRAVLGHTLLAFLFNTVIIVLLISALSG